MFQLKYEMESVIMLIFQSHPSYSHPLWYNWTDLGRQDPVSSKPRIFSTTPRKVKLIFEERDHCLSGWTVVYRKQRNPRKGWRYEVWFSDKYKKYFHRLGNENSPVKIGQKRLKDLWKPRRKWASISPYSAYSRFLWSKGIKGFQVFWWHKQALSPS